MGGRVKPVCVALLMCLASAQVSGQAAQTAKSLGQEQLILDRKRLGSLAGALRDMEAEMHRLRHLCAMGPSGYFPSDEHDQIEGLLFRYLTCRDSLWEMVNRYRNYREILDGPENQTRGFLIGLNAAMQLACHGSTLVLVFLQDDLVRKKLNEPYVRCDIPRGTYDRLFRSVTSIDNIQALRVAWQLFCEEAADPQSHLHRIMSSEPQYAALVEDTRRLYAVANDQIMQILESSALLLPELRNRLRHSVITELADRLSLGTKDNLYLARGLLFENVSRIRSPIARPAEFSPEQIARIKALLRPGDIILTFTSGYMSNIFLPGKFKHGITYVGSPEQRHAAGLTEANLASVPPPKLDHMKTALQVRSLPSGKDADVIEAVAEGVIFNSLEYLLGSHIARMVVLRPRLTAEQRAEQLLVVFLLLGNTYDFRFDFGSAEHHCCTEVIYRALHRRGPISFTLIKRAGVPTLSADDIIGYHLGRQGEVFDFVLLAEKARRSRNNEAELLRGYTGQRRLHRLMLPEQTRWWRRASPW